MSRHPQLQRDEHLIVSITPTPWGLTAPFLSVLLALGLVTEGAMHLHVIHQYEPVGLAILVGPPLLVLATRLWRWRSHKIHVTSEQLITEAGALRHVVSSISLDDVVSLEVEQRFNERLRRRGVVRVVTQQGVALLGPVRHPDALARIVEQARRKRLPSVVAYDTIFEPTLPPPAWQPRTKMNRQRR